MFQKKKTNQSTPFEKTLLSRLVNYKPLLTVIFELIDHNLLYNARIVATRVITSVARLTEQYQPRTPSIVGFLGSEAKYLVKKCLFRLQRFESEELRISILDLISTTVEIQRGLSELFLNLSLNSKEEEEKNSDLTIIKEFTSSSSSDKGILPEKGCVETILTILSEPTKGSSKVILSSLNVLQCIFERGEHKQITDILRNDDKFWKIILKTLSNRNPEIQSIT